MKWMVSVAGHNQAEIIQSIQDYIVNKSQRWHRWWKGYLASGKLGVRVLVTAFKSLKQLVKVQLPNEE